MNSNCSVLMQAVLRVDNVKVCKLKCIWDGAGLIMMDSWRGWTQYIYNLYKLASCIFQLENLKKQYKPNLVVELCNKYNRIIFILPPTQIFIRHLFRMIFLKVLWVPVLQTSQTMIGREEKNCLPSTEKKAAVDVDREKGSRWRRPAEKGRLHVDVDQKEKMYF